MQRSPPGRKLSVSIVIEVHGYPNLLQVIRAGHSPGRLACRLNCREKDPNEDADDGDHHQQFD
jgi:hypothetical protein